MTDWVAITAFVAAAGVVLNGLLTLVLQMVKSQTTSRVRVLEAQVSSLQAQLIASNNRSAADATVVSTLATQLNNEIAARQIDAETKDEIIELLQTRIEELTTEIAMLKTQNASLSTALAALTKTNAPQPEGPIA